MSLNAATYNNTEQPLSQFSLNNSVKYIGKTYNSFKLNGHHLSSIIGEYLSNLVDRIWVLCKYLFHIITDNTKQQTTSLKTIESVKNITHADISLPYYQKKIDQASNDKENDPAHKKEIYSEVNKKKNDFVEFKEKFERFSVWGKDIRELGVELLKIIPKNVDLEELVDQVFKKRYYEIPILLDAILAIYPSFTLSPYNQIRRTIVEDKEHRITNETLISMQKHYGLDVDKEKTAACYQLAYRMNNPYIFQPAQKPVQSHDYTLNFLWVNLNPQHRIQDKARNIFGDGLNQFEDAECIKDPQALYRLEKLEQTLDKEASDEWVKIKKTFTYRISKWADIHPNSQINLWYDSALVTEKARQKTFEMMRDISRCRGVNLKLRDIRQLPIINEREEIENSLHPCTPVYYRVDLLKVLIADHMISSPEESAKYFVFSDIDIEPMNSQQMFDQRTLDYLGSSGYVFNRVGSGEFENSFFIFNREKKDLQQIHYEYMIEGINHLIKGHIGPRNLSSESIYGLYFHFYHRMEMESFDEDRLLAPRKVVKCPPSQFSPGQKEPDFTDHISEKFRFDGTTPKPISGGRYYKSKEDIEELMYHWRAEPLVNLSSA